MTLKYCAVEADLNRYMDEQDAHENYLEFRRLCDERATDIGKLHNLHEDLFEPFIEWFIELNEGLNEEENYLSGLIFFDKSLIDDFWKKEGEYYDEFTTPYKEVN